MKPQTKYQVTAAVRRFLESLPSGEYTRQEIMSECVKRGIVDAWQFGPATVKNAIEGLPSEEGRLWSHNGGVALNARYIKAAPAKPVISATKADDTDRGPVASRMARIEAMLEALCRNLGVEVPK